MRPAKTPFLGTNVPFATDSQKIKGNIIGIPTKRLGFPKHFLIPGKVADLTIVVVGLGKPTEPKLKVDLSFGFTTEDKGQKQWKQSE